MSRNYLSFWKQNNGNGKKLMMRDRLSPFIRTSVETTVISDVGGSPVVRVEEEEDVGVDT